ncbi:hypothetical protein MKW98_009794 [Papaver atlanticum]|uniref:Uncharacterized protein n=1 Tax=Papaver atlanticum TaxID=357466 RepID=A0AAD4SWQ5_9MAGN|nr:hypothetical protein MKW98_009794 [Papaver atlanticum]
MKVQVISKEIIKPSTPTPPHLRNFKLSLLDQLLPPFYIPIVIFYPANDGHNDQTSNANILKKSLPETLTRFYPIAGRMRDNISIDCNDEGVDYIEAKVNAVMSDFMSVDVVHRLHPSYITVDVVAKEAQLAVQVNLFACGGIAISICLSHKIADGCTVLTFINSWAATARVALNREIVYPTFDSAAIFPALPPEVQVSSLESNNSIRGENVVTKLFLFNASKISAIRARIAASRSSNVLSKYPTRSEAISALVWKSFMETSRVKVTRDQYTYSAASRKPIIIRSRANFVVNLRPWLSPPLPHVSFGNIITDALAESTIMVFKESPLGFGETLDGLISQLRLGVSKINDEYIRQLHEGDVEFIKALEEASHHSNGENTDEKAQICWISSLCSLPLYETDFGWGKPSWFVLNTFSEFKNSVFLVDTKCGAGIEAWVSLEEEDMVIFEKDQDILQYATLHTPDPVVGFTNYPSLRHGNTTEEPALSRL